MLRQTVLDPSYRQGQCWLTPDDLQWERGWGNGRISHSKEKEKKNGGTNVVKFLVNPSGSK
jgi:hypothetical protein